MSTQPPYDVRSSVLLQLHVLLAEAVQPPSFLVRQLCSCRNAAGRYTPEFFLPCFASFGVWLGRSVGQNTHVTCRGIAAERLGQTGPRTGPDWSRLVLHCPETTASPEKSDRLVTLLYPLFTQRAVPVSPAPPD